MWGFAFSRKKTHFFSLIYSQRVRPNSDKFFSHISNVGFSTHVPEKYYVWDDETRCSHYAPKHFLYRTPGLPQRYVLAVVQLKSSTKALNFQKIRL